MPLGIDKGVSPSVWYIPMILTSSRRLFRTVILFLSAVSLLFSLAGCFLHQEKSVVLWAARPEIASYVELFNSQQEEYRIELMYREHPGYALLTESAVPDLIISDYLMNSRTAGRLTDLSYLFEEELLQKDLFYPSLLEYGTWKESQATLPVSFNLPAMIFRKAGLENKIGPFILNLEEIRELNRDFTLTQNGELDATTPLFNLGYSPRWDAEFLYSLAVILGTSFRETSEGVTAWNQAMLENSVNYARDWISEDNGGYNRCRSFSDKYLYSPGYKLVNSGRILFSHTNARRFFTIPKENQENLGIRWIGIDNKIRVEEDILSLGIPEEGKNKKGAAAFITWFYKPETQAELLRTAKFKRIRTFGIGQGFSALRHINEREFPIHYPALAGHIPPEGYLDFPEYMPLRWKNIKKQVVIPWLFEAVDENGARRELKNRLQTWYLQRPIE